MELEDVRRRLDVLEKDHKTHAEGDQLEFKATREFVQKAITDALADADDVEAVTRKINGGLNGLVDREAILARVRAVIGV